MSEQATESESVTPQEDQGRTFDAEYVQRLRSESARYRTEAKANADAAGRVPSLEEERDALKSERDTLAGRVMRTQVALVKGLPADLADRLRGDTEDALSEDADRLLALVKPPDPPRFGDADQGVRTATPPADADERQTARRLFGSST